MKKIISILLMSMAFIFAPVAHADENSYLTRLANAGYTGPVAKWLAMGHTVCSLEAQGMPKHAIAYGIVVNTGRGIYTADAYEIISIANDELCPQQSTGGTYA